MKTLEEASIARNWEGYLDYLDRRLKGIQTGISCLDKYLLGLGGITTFQGDTGCNKSTLALQIAHYNMLKGMVGVMWDRENGDGRIRSRLICQANNISETDQLAASMEQRRIYAGKVTALPLHVWTDNPTHEDMRRVVAEALDLYQRPVVMIVDSIQKMPAVDDDQRVNLEKWFYFMDELKVRYNGQLTILVTSEVKRAGYESTEGIGRGKGTNSIEYTTETLLDMRPLENGNISVQVSKHRDGIKGASFELEKCLADKTNPRSFTFKLQEPSAIDI